jgi:hypothetical protein
LRRVAAHKLRRFLQYHYGFFNILFHRVCRLTRERGDAYVVAINPERRAGPYEYLLTAI